MAGLVPAIHVFGATTKEDVDARHKGEHDESSAEAAPSGYSSPDSSAALPPAAAVLIVTVCSVANRAK